MRDSVVFYRSFLDAIEDFPPEDFKTAVMALMGYALDDIEPEVSGLAKVFFKMAKPQIDTNNKRYQNGTKGGKPKTKAEPNENQDLTKPKPKHNQNITKPEPNVNVNVNDNVNVKDRCNTRFAPPDLESVRGYCREKGYNIDAERFINFYESKGWMVGKNKMKDWKAAVRNWAKQDAERKQEKSAQKPPNRFHNFEQSNTSYDDLLQQKLFAKMAGGE